MALKKAATPRRRTAAATRQPAVVSTRLVDPALQRKGSHLGKSLVAVTAAVATHPVKAVQSVARTGTEMLKALGGGSTIAPAAGDRRFEDPAWRDSPVYRRLMQSYLALASGTQRLTEDLELDPRDAGRAKMVLGMMADTFAPTNTLLGNPAALKRTLDTGGGNLAKGVKQLLLDMRRGNGLPASVDQSKFAVGTNLATTPGAVVYRDEQLELIQYRPTTEKVHGTPVFIVPPQINKYYVWDLAPGRSLVEYLVREGHQVFVVSWFNPGKKQADWGLATYVLALERAMEVTREVTATSQMHVVGACSGGITAAALLAYLAAKKRNWARSLTLLVAILDTQGIADTSLGLFAHLETLELARGLTGASGVLEGKDLARIFAWLRPNELIWNYWVNNYLMGEKPPAFDILYWNADTTRLPAQLHGDFVSLLQTNAFAVPGGLRIDGHPLDLAKVRCDSYILGGTTDHITPWEGCYQTRRLLGGRSEFVLSSSGHVQSIVNPPGGRKAAFATHAGAHATPEQFKAGAVQTEGTWWPHFSAWLAARSIRAKTAADHLGSRRHKPLADAPGTYVRRIA